MKASGELLSSPGDRLVALGAFAIRPVPYVGEDASGPFEPPPLPIDGLLVRIEGQRRNALFHAALNVYGFLDLAEAEYRVTIVDPIGRFAPCAVKGKAPDRAPLRIAIKSAAAELPAVPNPPIRVARLRPAPGARAAAGIHGSIFDAFDAPLPFAWIRVHSPDGDFVTHANENGEYLAPLPFARRPSNDEATTKIQIRVHRFIAAIPANAEPSSIVPIDFDKLETTSPKFKKFYEKTALIKKTVDFAVGTSVRLDLQP